MKKKKKQLRMTKINDFNLIQLDMLEKGCDDKYIPEKLYKHSDEVFGDGYNILYAFVDKAVIKGFIWLVINVLRGTLIVNVFYIDEEYKEVALKQLKVDLLRVKEELKLTKVLWVTSKLEDPKKIGFVEDDEVIMRLEEEDKNKD